MEKFPKNLEQEHIFFNPPFLKQRGGGRIHSVEDTARAPAALSLLPRHVAPKFPSAACPEQGHRLPLSSGLRAAAGPAIPALVTPLSLPCLPQACRPEALVRRVAPLMGPASCLFR